MFVNISQDFLINIYFLDFNIQFNFIYFKFDVDKLDYIIIILSFVLLGYYIVNIKFC